MVRLGVNIDHVATLRQARGETDPDPIAAAVLAETAGADGIVVHLREDRRHIQDRDLRLLRETVRTKLNLEMAPIDEILKIALSVKPDMVTLVPERREERTTEGGLDVTAMRDRLQRLIQQFHDAGVAVSLFVEPDPVHVRTAHRVKADYIEIHTGRFAGARLDKKQNMEFDAIELAAKEAFQMGLGVNAGHGLNIRNIRRLLSISEIVEYNIGHSIISRAVMIGLERAVREIKDLLDKN
ncbi:MAG TPA: pyridoxine 5'-phosphate synthase [Nitrospiria bacterium]